MVNVETETWQVLVRTLTGRSFALQVSNSLSGHCLDCLLAERVGVPVGSFYVLRNGRVWRDGGGLQRGDTLQMVGRLLGGARQPPVFVPGQWTCTSFGMEGCWPSKMRCFRCLAPRSDGTGADFSRPVFGRGNARERSYLGQPAVSRNRTTPTIRHTRNAGAPAPVPPGPVAQEAPPMVDLSDAAMIAKVLSLLASLGVSDVLLLQVKSSIPPPAANKQKSAGPEKQ